MGEPMRKRFQLRGAGGTFWLLDMAQPGMPYRAPMEINEVGADIWRLHVQQGLSPEETAERMSGEYGVQAEVILPDIYDFLAQLKAQGIEAEEGAQDEGRDQEMV